VIDQPLMMLPSTLAIVIGRAHALLPYGVLSVRPSTSRVI
jgi:ABC-type spermidine/putrescine transport system permease subunit I